MDIIHNYVCEYTINFYNGSAFPNTKKNERKIADFLHTISLKILCFLNAQHKYVVF